MSNEVTKHVQKLSSATYIRYYNSLGHFHREDGPAYVIEYRDGGYYEEWCENDTVHRYGGPCITDALSPNKITKEYYVHGKDVKDEVMIWLHERDYTWETMSDVEKWELDMFMRSLR